MARRRRRIKLRDEVGRFRFPCVRHGDAVEGLFAGHSCAHGECRRAQEPARIGDAVVGVESDQDAGAIEYGGVGETGVARLDLSAWAVDHRRAQTDARCRDLVRHLVPFRPMLQHDSQPKLPGQAQNRGDVIMRVRVVLHQPLAF